MIESVGHTTDGLTWMRFHFKADGQEQMTGTLEMTQDFTKWLISSLCEALKKAEEATDVRDSTNLN